MTKISDLLGRRPLPVSVELWPPRTPPAEERLEAALGSLYESIRPTFCSITYGAAGSTRERTHDLVVRIQNDEAMVPMAHLTCAAHSRVELTEILCRYREAGVENVLALKGDPPLDGGSGIAPGDLTHAVELVELAKSVGDFCVAVAAHPECHPDSPDRSTDRRQLAAKLKRADFAITQFFFDAEDYVRLVEELAELGVEKPVLPGILPITNSRTLEKMAEMSGCRIPDGLAQRITATDDADEVRRIGVDVATELAEKLLDAGAPGLHFYTMNVAAATIEVCERLGLTGGSP